MFGLKTVFVKINFHACQKISTTCINQLYCLTLISLEKICLNYSQNSYFLFFLDRIDCSTRWPRRSLHSSQSHPLLADITVCVVHCLCNVPVMRVFSCLGFLLSQLSGDKNKLSVFEHWPLVGALASLSVQLNWNQGMGLKTFRCRDQSIDHSTKS